MLIPKAKIFITERAERAMGSMDYLRVCLICLGLGGICNSFELVLVLNSSFLVILLIWLLEMMSELLAIFILIKKPSRISILNMLANSSDFSLCEHLIVNLVTHT